MKFVCEKNTLQKELAFAQEIITSKNSISVLSNVYLEADNGSLRIKATDIKVNFDTIIPVEVQESGSTTVFCDKLFGIIMNLPEGEIEFEQIDNKITLKPLFKKIKFQLKCISSDKFPELPIVPENAYFTIPARELKDMITNTVFAVSDDETRYFMNGVFLENIDSKLIMVATDGRRLSFIEKATITELTSFKGVIIPPKVLNILYKHCSDENPVSMAIGEKNVFFRFGNYNISSVLIEGQFPNYQRVIPEKQLYSLKTKRSDFLDALRRISILVEQKSRRAFFAVSENTISISTDESELGIAKEEIACEYSGPEMVFALNYRYLDEPLKVMESENIELHFSEATRAITVYPEPHKDFFNIIMPMQVE